MAVEQSAAADSTEVKAGERLASTAVSKKKEAKEDR